MVAKAGSPMTWCFAATIRGTPRPGTYWTPPSTQHMWLAKVSHPAFHASTATRPTILRRSVPWLPSYHQSAQANGSSSPQTHASTNALLPLVPHSHRAKSFVYHGTGGSVCFLEPVPTGTPVQYVVAWSTRPETARIHQPTLYTSSPLGTTAHSRAPCRATSSSSSGLTWAN